MLYQLRFIDSEGKPSSVNSPNKKAARTDAKDLIESGNAEELIVVDDRGRFVWYVTGGVSDETRNVGGSLVYFSDEWPADREWKDVVGVPS